MFCVVVSHVQTCVGDKVVGVRRGTMRGIGWVKLLEGRVVDKRMKGLHGSAHARAETKTFTQFAFATLKGQVSAAGCI